MLANLKEMTGSSGEVVPQAAASLDLPAPRPADSSLTSVYLPHLDVPPMPPLEAALKEFSEGAG